MQNVKKMWFSLPNKIRFFLVGSLNAAISYVFYIVFCLVLGSTKYQIALILSWLFSSVISFSTQKYFVFQSDGKCLQEYAKCCISWTISYLFNALFLEICIKIFILNIFIAQIISTLLAAIVTYILFKYFAFKDLS